MKTLVLTDDLVTGINDIDNQHRQLFKWANEVADDEALADDGKFMEAANNLQEYVSAHFRAEEQAMETYGFNGLEKHGSQHKRLMREVGQLLLRAKWEGASKGLKIELQYMFADWITLHIKEWDKAFAKFMQNNDLTAVPLPDVFDF